MVFCVYRCLHLSWIMFDNYNHYCYDESILKKMCMCGLSAYPRASHEFHFRNDIRHVKNILNQADAFARIRDYESEVETVFAAGPRSLKCGESALAEFRCGEELEAGLALVRQESSGCFQKSVEEDPIL